MKTRPVGVELFRADRRTDTTKLFVNFRNFANAPNIGLSHSILRLNNIWPIKYFWQQPVQWTMKIEDVKSVSWLKGVVL